MFGNNLKELRKIKNLTMDEAVEKINRKYEGVIHINKGNLSRWENNKVEPKLSTVRVLADFYGLSVDDIVEGNFNQSKKTNISSVYNQLEDLRQRKVYNFAEHQLEEQNKVKETVQVYGDAAAGAPIDYVDGFVDEEEVETVPEGANRALRIKGNSMSPLLRDGQLVFYKAQPQLENGQVGIFEIHGEAVTCKRYKVDFNDQKIVLQSENPEYEDMVFNGNEVRILGEVKL